MGFFDGWNDTSSVVSRKSHKSHKSSHKRHKREKLSRSRSRSKERRSSKRSPSPGLESLLGEDSNYAQNNASRGSFFGLGNGSTRSFFSTGRSPSYYKRSPRANYMNRAYKKLKRLLRDLVYWAKRHPVKVFMLVIMPLITGGALTALLARFGLRLPANIQRMLGMAAKTAGGTAGGIGLMGSAARMVSGGLGGNHSTDDLLSYGEGLHYERRLTEYTDFGSSSGGGGGFFKRIGNFFS